MSEHRVRATRRVLFVCTGNTCRSPMAAALLKQLAADAGLDVAVQSAGLAAFPGDPVNENAQAVLRERGLDATGEQAQAVDEQLLAWADVILTMTKFHREQLQSEFPHFADRVHVLPAYATGASHDIDDPFGGDKEQYRATLTELERYLRKIVERWSGEVG